MPDIVAIYQLAIPQIGRERKLRLSITIYPMATPAAAPMRPAPLIDELPRERKAGRPSRRPDGVPQSIWSQWVRNVSSRGQPDTPEAFAQWMARRRITVPAKRVHTGWTKRAADPYPEVHWTTVVHRKDLTPELETEWRRRISRARHGDPVYRIHLRGIQLRVVR